MRLSRQFECASCHSTGFACVRVCEKCLSTRVCAHTGNVVQNSVRVCHFFEKVHARDVLEFACVRIASFNRGVRTGVSLKKDVRVCVYDFFQKSVCVRVCSGFQRYVRAFACTCLFARVCTCKRVQCVRRACAKGGALTCLHMHNAAGAGAVTGQRDPPCDV